MDRKWKRIDISIPMGYTIVRKEATESSVNEFGDSRDGFILNIDKDMLKLLIEKGARTGDLIKAEMEIFEILQDNSFTAEILKLEKEKEDFETAVVKITKIEEDSREKLGGHISRMQTDIERMGKQKEKRMWERTETFLNVKYDLIAHKEDKIDPDSFVFHSQLPFYGRILDISEGGLRFFRDTNNKVSIGDVLEVLTEIPSILQDQHFLIKVVADRGRVKGEVFGCTFLKIKKSYRELLIDHIAKKG